MATLLSVCRPLPHVVYVTVAGALSVWLKGSFFPLITGLDPPNDVPQKNTQGCPAKTGQPYVFVDRAEHDGLYGIGFSIVTDKVYACKLK